MPETVFGWLKLTALVAWLVLGLIAATHAVRYKRDPRSAALWVVISIDVPIVGPWLYWAFGINRVERRAVKSLGPRFRPFDGDKTEITEPPRETLKDTIGHLESLQRIADRITRLPMLSGNKIEPLHDGEQAYPRMLDAIAGAERSVSLTSYIFDWDDVGQAFTDALSDAAQRGVQVHALLDGVGALRSFSRVGRRLLQSGAEVAAFFPLRFPLGRLRLNLRNHRKILVIDGHRGFTGGMNISAKHLANSDRPDRAHDLHFEITGPVVAEMQHVFAEDWALAKGEVLQGEDYYPELQPTGSAISRGISSGPDENFGTIHWMIVAALAAARQSVRIVTPYFVPTSTLISAMTMAAIRGVHVTLVLPSVVDVGFMRWVADAYLWQLLEHGVRVYRQPPPFVHTKLIVVDDCWTLLGSANLDPRSFRLNFEFNVEAYEPELAARLSTWLDQRISAAKPVTKKEIDARPFWKQIRDGAFKMFSPHL